MFTTNKYRKVTLPTGKLMYFNEYSNPGNKYLQSNTKLLLNYLSQICLNGKIDRVDADSDVESDLSSVQEYEDEDEDEDD